MSRWPSLRTSLRRPTIEGSALLGMAVALLVGVPYLLRLALLRVRAFNPDELQHLHGAWSIARGMLPYRDYFDHHPPFVHVLLAPLFRVFDVDRDLADAVRSLLFARGAMWVLTGILLALTFLLGRRWGGSRVAWVGLLLLSNTPVFLHMSLEVRPDVPAVVLVMGALLVAIGRRPNGEAPGPGRWVWIGLLLGAAVMFTPKTVFALPAFGLAVLRPPTPQRAQRWASLAALVASLALPPAVTVAYFAWRGALRQFLYCNVAVPLQWQRGSGPGEMIADLLRPNPVLLLGLVMLGPCLFAGWRERHRDDILLAGTTLLFIAGVFQIPEIAPQYFLLFLPMLALLAAAALLALLDVAFAAVRPRLRTAVVTLLLAALSVMPLREQALAFLSTNAAQLEGLAFVLRNTEPTESVMDGFSGLGVFRPHTNYHYFLLGKIRRHWPPRDRRRLLARLREGAVAPKLVIWDLYLRGLSDEISAFLEANYAPVGRDPIRARLFDNGTGSWRDEGARPLQGAAGLGDPHVLLRDGWRPRSSNEPTGYARTLGTPSELLVPVRDPVDFVALVRARVESRGPVTVALDVNARHLGTAMATSEWSDLRFELPRAAMKPGFNLFRLSVSPAAAGATPELTVASLGLRRLEP